MCVIKYQTKARASCKLQRLLQWRWQWPAADQVLFQGCILVSAMTARKVPELALRLRRWVKYRAPDVWQNAPDQAHDAADAQLVCSVSMSSPLHVLRMDI